MFTVKNRTAVVTGAGSGIGAALAAALARDGCHLALVDRDAAGLEATRDALAHRDVRVTLHAADITAPGFPERLVEEVTAAHGGCHVLINNAGIAQGGTFAQIPAEDFDRLMAVNFDAPVRLMRAFLPLLLASGASKIVNISSLFGLIAPPGQSVYCASKFALRGLSESLRAELADTSVGVLVVHPGGIDTNIARNSVPPPGVSPEQHQAAIRTVQKSLVMDPAKAAEIILRAMQHNKRRVLVGRDAWLFDKVQRIMPTRYMTVLSMMMRWAA